MRVLILGPNHQKISTVVKNSGDEVIINNEEIDINFMMKQNINFIVSFGYRYRIKPEILEFLNGQAINLHMSYLPFNRGNSPNLWSQIEDTPSGVTIHKVDNGWDTGNILFQKKIDINENIHTLATSYNLLYEEMEKLFELNWNYLRTSECNGWAQQGDGTFHHSNQFKILEKCFTNKWDTTILEFKKNYFKYFKNK